ncbi:MAG TPA: type II toxin-antitoxin system VapC family toxin [Caulobacteraceae bacterium]|nr:type II toxin-antitoxin system VapC family toxin [Caulobacteraceae bacterium]
MIDASALAAMLFGEPEAMSIARSVEDSRLLAPLLLDFELANVCWKKCRRSVEQRPLFLAAYALRRAIAIELTAVDHDEALALALQTDLTVYDASYLWLSRKLGVELVTLDAKLASVAANAV